MTPSLLLSSIIPSGNLLLDIAPLGENASVMDVACEDNSGNNISFSSYIYKANVASQCDPLYPLSNIKLYPVFP